MIPFSEKQAQIDLLRLQAIEQYSTLLLHVLDEWQSPNQSDRVWLTYSSNYLLSTNNVKWALDPLIKEDWLPKSVRLKAIEKLNDLSFILLSHEHDDHLDLDLIRELHNSPIQWVVPQTLHSIVVNVASVPQEKIIIPKQMVPINIQGITIIPFDGLHWDNNSMIAEEAFKPKPRGVPTTGYLIEFSGKRWLFPNDVRTYDIQLLPSFGQIDGLFAHLWLGRGAALFETPPYLESFCQFCKDTGAARVIITHMDEFGRDANDFWDISHLHKVITYFNENMPNLAVSPAFMGDCVEL